MDTLTWKQGYYFAQDILRILAEHEFLPRLPALRDDVRSTIAEGLKFYGVELEAPPPNEVAPLGPGPRQLDLITLECACVCVKHGIREIHYNETLNNLRWMVRELIGHFGYRFNWAFHGHTVWGGYGEWAELGQLCGFSDSDIAARHVGCVNDMAEGRGVCFPPGCTGDALATQLGIFYVGRV